MSFKESRCGYREVLAAVGCLNGREETRTDHFVFLALHSRTFDSVVVLFKDVVVVKAEGFGTSATGLRYMRAPMNYIGDGRRSSAIKSQKTK